MPGDRRPGDWSAMTERPKRRKMNTTGRFLLHHQVGERSDALGQLARVFQGMAEEVAAREQRLRREVQQLKIEIDEVRAARQVEEITESEYFRRLQQKVDELRIETSR